MVLPDGTGSHPGKPQTGRVILVALAGLVVVGGFVGLSALSSTDPEAAVETTSTPSTTPRSTTSTLDVENFTVADIAQGEPLQWGQVMAIDYGYATALVEHDGSWYLFSSDSDLWASDSDEGLLAWRSSNGVDWEPLGQVIGPEHTLNGRVVADGGGLLALESDETGTGFFLWRSGNGADWTREQIELSNEQGSTGVFPHAIGGNGEISLVFGSNTSGNDPVYERLTAAVGDVVDLDDYGWSPEVVGEEIIVTVYGPLGIPLLTYSAEELGLTAPEREQVLESYSGAPQPALIWRSTDGISWEETSIEGVDWVESIASTPNGRLVVFGYGPTGARIFTSSDGIAYEPSSEVVQPYSVQTWGDLLVGAGSGIRPSVMVSTDAELWEDIGPAGVFPEGIQWQIGVLGAGPGGIAAEVIGFPGGDDPPEPPEHVILVDGNGAELSLDLDGAIRLTSPDGEEQLLSITGMTPEDAHLDLASGEMVFTDRETGEEMASFGLEELKAAETAREFAASPSTSPSFNALIFTPDTSTWTIQDYGDVARNSHITHLEVTDTHVIAVRVADEFDPGSTSGFEVWAAEIP